MKEAGEPFDPKAYLPTITGYYSTSKGEMLSFPFNSSSDGDVDTTRTRFKKAGLDPTSRPKTWPEVFDAAKKLKAAGHRQLRLLQRLGDLGSTSSSSPPGTTCRSPPRPTASTASTRC